MSFRALMPAVMTLALALSGPTLGADDPPPAAAPPAAAPSADPAPVRIGILTDESGVYANNAGTGNVIAARLAIADYGGKVLGRPIELLDADHKNDPAVGSQILTDWFDNAGVEAVAGLSTSSVALAAQEIGRARGKTLLIAGAPDSDLAGKACAATSSHWSEDTEALARSTADAVVPSGGDSWFFVTVDQAFGLAMERDAEAAVRHLGASVLGRIHHPLGAGDFSAILDAAEKSDARIIALADAGADMVGFVKQADAAQIRSSRQSLAGLLVYITDVDAIGLAAAQRLYVTDGFYWDQNDQARAFAKRFNAEAHHMPTKQQAATYASVSHYLKAADAAGTLDAEAVNAKMREMPADFFGRAATVRTDGQVVYDLTLYQVKSSAESQYPWDYYKKVRDIPAARAFRPVAEGGCPLAK
jgi:branched-chain amino acid transport system substrate-binding protein